MKIVVEALCAEFGGIRTYVEHLLERWGSCFPDDELHVLVAEGSSLPTVEHTRHEIIVRRPRLLGRPLAQTTGLRRAVNDLRPDAVLATLPSTTVLRPAAPLAVVVYDLRHELRPEQFSLTKRLIRNVSYGRGYALANGLIAISQRSLDDLHELHPRTARKPSTIAYLGADHVAAWPEASRVGPSITFAHHNNKNVDLVLDGWVALTSRRADVPPLLMLGVPASERERLSAAIAERGLASSVMLSGFLPEEKFRTIMAEAEMVVFPTDFEGFGLPVVEGMYLGKPVVIGPERATMEVASGHAFVLQDWSAEALAEAVTSARASSVVARLAAKEHAATFTWDRTVRKTRAILARIGGS